MKKTLIIVGIAAAAITFAAVRTLRNDKNTIAGRGAGEVWTCSMHPGVRLPLPGKCPICEMPLIPAGSGSSAHDGMLHLHGAGAGLLETAAVERRTLQHTMRAVGKIGYNESGLTTITSRVEGYVEKLFVNFTGVEVKKGDHFAEIYSPDLAVAQRELQLGKSDTADRTLLQSQHRCRRQGFGKKRRGVFHSRRWVHKIRGGFGKSRDKTGRRHANSGEECGHCRTGPGFPSRLAG